jgi:hypothetical protein
MDFYNLQENDHRLIEQTLSHRLSGGAVAPDYKESLQRQFFNFDRVLNKKSILLAEEDPRIQRAMQKMILEANQSAQCWIVDSVDEISDLLDEKECDLLIANYYLSEDEIDYEFWEMVRGRYPHMEVIILSHVNDREYYEALVKMSREDHEGQHQPFSAKLKHFFEHVFGG